MGISAALEREDGTVLETVHDERNLLHRVLPPPEDPTFHWVSTIDWYGDTTFNRLQAARLRVEWAQLIRSSGDPETKALLQRIDDLIGRCSSEVHRYVKFYGD